MQKNRNNQTKNNKKHRQTAGPNDDVRY